MNRFNSVNFKFPVLKLKKWAVALFVVFQSLALFGQVDNQFWFAIPKETNGHGYLDAINNVSFKIAAMGLDAHVKISMPADTSFKPRTFTVLAGMSHVEVLATDFATFAKLYSNPSAVGTIASTGKTSYPDGRGFLIESDNDITVYYDYDNYWNRQLFSLKGKNALGMEFYTPLQNIWTQYNYARSDIDIVATEDNTVIRIEPTVILDGRSDMLPFNITLNKGETYSLVAKDQNPSSHPAGTHITVLSGGPIAVTVNDDSAQVQGQGCADIIGDQIVPTNIIGKKYLVMCGYEATQFNNASVQEPRRGEQIFVVATQPGTIITYQDTAGNILRTSPAIGAGMVDYMSPNIAIPSQNAIFVNSNNPIYVLHLTGIGCEMGGALLPPITDCTGSSEVTFYRSGTVSKLTLNLMIPYNTSEPFDAADQSYKFFRIYYDDGSSVPIDPTWFEPVKSAGWAALKFDKRDIPPSLIPFDKAVKVVNTKDFFHLGITNGGGGQTDKYGYFSSFNVATAKANVATINEPSIVSCFGDTVILIAKGGLEYTWHYGSPTGPPTYLSDYKSAYPRVFCPPGTHNFHVTVRQAKCFGDVTLPVTVFVQPEVKAAFETDKTVGCAPMKINFTNTSVGADIFEWTIKKDNGPEITFIPSADDKFVMPNSGFFQNTTQPYQPNHYTFRLKASLDYICKDSIKKEIVVYPQVKANFQPLDTVGCHPVITPFRNLSSGNVTDSTYTWSFGDGASSVLKHPIHSYLNQFKNIDTVYHVQLVAASPYYCRDTARSTITVHPYIKASFTVDSVTGCSPLTIRINNNSDNKTAISQYTWDFGDGTVRHDAKDTLMHSYPVNTSSTVRTYRLLLMVNHAFGAGCPDTMSRLITVYPQTTIGLLMNPNKADLCDSTLVKFTAVPSAAISSYLWDFGDGNTSTLQNPSHLFTNLTNSDVTYKVKLTGMSAQYCNGYATKDVVVHAFLDPQFGLDIPSNCAPFKANVKNKSRGGIVKYDWYYGDLGHDNHSITDTVHTYQNTTNSDLAPLVKLVVTNSGGCKDSVSQRIEVYPEIKANFSSSLLFGCNPLPINFTNQSTYVNSNPAVAKYFQWDFNDGTSSTDKNPSHIFANTSSVSVTYHVKLTVNSEHNCTADTTKDISVLPYLEAKFSVDSVNGCSPFPVKLTNASRGKIDVYQWTYGDGAVDAHNSLTFSHTYLNNSAINPPSLPLQRYLKLLVTNSGGQCVSRDSVLITTYPEVETKFQADVKEGCNPLSVNFTNQSGPGTVPVEYSWDFGDNGSFDTKFKTPPASHSFINMTALPKKFITTLQATSQYKCTSKYSDTILVYPFIKADFAFDQSSGCSPYVVTIKNSSSPGANSYYWYMGDKPTPYRFNGFFPPYTYHNQTAVPVTYSPKLVVYYNNGTQELCKDSVIRDVLIYPEVTADFTQDTLSICSPDSIVFTNRSSIGTHFLLPAENDLVYDWTFGDNGASSQFSPRHFYMNYNNSDKLLRTVKLDVTSKYLCKSSKSKTVTIYPKPKARFEAAKSIDCPPFILPIQNLTVTEPIVNYNWDFGDGNSFTTQVLETVTHTYENATADIASYNLRLNVETEHNCSDTYTQTINVYPHVIANFTPDTAGCSPLLVLFSNKTIRGDRYQWDFGDQVSSKITSPSHKFFNPEIYDSTYTARLIAFSKYECSDTITRKIKVYPQPEAEFSALPTHLYFPDNRITLKNETNVGNWNYKWNFADSQTTTVKEPKTHEFLHWGGYDVQLNVWSQHCKDSISHHIRVFAPIPIADFDMTENGCVPWTIKFTDKSTWATSWYWEFDDGSTSTEQNPTHIYETPGKFEVKLTVTGDGGSAFTYRTVEVFPKPTVLFKYTPELVMLGNAKVQFYNNSKLGTRFVWDFGDSTRSSELEPSHTYQAIGKYNVTLSVWSVHECFDSLRINNAIEVIGTGDMRFPNAFKPDINGPGDGKFSLPDPVNQVFHPYYQGVVEYHLEIYDRLGEKIFDSTDPTKGWDGYYKNKLCKSDVYIWKAIGKFTNGQTFDMAGDVTLLK